MEGIILKGVFSYWSIIIDCRKEKLTVCCNLLGFLLHKFTKPQQAIVQYREAVRLSPGHFYANEGLILFQCLSVCVCVMQLLVVCLVCWLMVLVTSICRFSAMSVGLPAISVS